MKKNLLIIKLLAVCIATLAVSCSNSQGNETAKPKTDIITQAEWEEYKQRHPQGRDVLSLTTNNEDCQLLTLPELVELHRSNDRHQWAKEHGFIIKTIYSDYRVESAADLNERIRFEYFKCAVDETIAEVNLTGGEIHTDHVNGADFGYIIQYTDFRVAGNELNDFYEEAGKLFKEIPKKQHGSPDKRVYQMDDLFIIINRSVRQIGITVTNQPARIVKDWNEENYDIPGNG